MGTGVNEFELEEVGVDEDFDTEGVRGAAIELALELD